MKAQKLSMPGFWLVLAIGIIAAVPVGGASDALPERFSEMTPGQTVAGWRSLTFEKIASHTRYTLVDDGGQTVLFAEAEASASGMIKPLDLDPHAWSELSWRWKVSRTYDKGDVTRKSGDDYAARIYITFEVPPEKLSFFERTKLAAIRMVYGESPPSAALAYIWANRAQVGSMHPNPYTGRVRMIVVDSGPTHAKQWRSVRRDIVDDFKRAFGEDPPRISSIAVMTDSDDTGESANAWYGDIVFSR